MQYKIVITFDTDRPMTRDEISAMKYHLRPQVEEPMVWDNTQDDFTRSDLRTTDIELELGKAGE